MKRVAVFPGSFDPITKGHEEIVRRAASLFDELIIAVGRNTSKSTLFSEEKRLVWISQIFSDLPHVRAEVYEGLTVDFCKKNNARHIIRGVRNSGDFEYEMAIAAMNKALWNDVDTLLLASDPRWIALSSTIVREIIKNKGDVSQFLPEGVNVYG